MGNWVDPSDVPARLAGMQPAATFVGAVNAAGITYTVPQVMGGYLDRSGAVTVSDTTPTAAALVAALPAAGPNDMKALIIKNRNSGVLTILGGAGVLIDGTQTIANGTSRTFGIRVNSRTPGAEQVSFVVMD